MRLFFLNLLLLLLEVQKPWMSIKKYNEKFIEIEKQDIYIYILIVGVG